jgi:microcystin-dependent protein
MDPVLAEIVLFAGNFAPRSYAFCDGRLISIAENNALFALLGTTYGGDGQVTFALPDLRGRIPVGTGQGPGLPSITLGEMSGSENVTLTTLQIPAHNHAGNTAGDSGAASTATPTSNVLASTDTGSAIYADGPASNKMSPNSVQLAATGSNLPHNNIMPVLALNYIIAVEGIFPSRN